jgi:hypothetical protein
VPLQLAHAPLGALAAVAPLLDLALGRFGLLLLFAHLVLRLLQLGAQRVDQDLEIGLRRGQRLLGRLARRFRARQALGAVGGRGRLRARGGWRAGGRMGFKMKMQEVK